MMDENIEEKIESYIDLALKKHDENIQKFIASNSTLIYEAIDKIKISIEAIGVRVAKVEETVKNQSTKIQELESSLEFTQQLVDDKVEDIDKQINNKLHQHINDLNQCIYHTNQEAKYLKNKLRTLEDRNRRNNLRIDGLKENDHESWEDSERKVKDLIKNKLAIEEDIIIERAHRIGKKEHGKNRSIIFKLQSWKQKEVIIKNSNKLRNTGIYVNEDFSDETMLIRKELFKQMKKERDDGKFAKVIYDKLYVRDFRPPQG